MITLFTYITEQLQLPIGLLAAVCNVESHHNPYAIHIDDGSSHRTSYGICQVQYQTAKELLKYEMPNFHITDLFNPRVNMLAAGLYLKRGLNKHDSVELALAMYNGGHVIVRRDGKLASSKYIRKVMYQWNREKVTYLVLRKASVHL